jgi:hypothetical protein
MKRLSMNIPNDLHKRLRRYAVEEDLKMTEIVLRLIEDFLSKAEPKLKK